MIGVGGGCDVEGMDMDGDDEYEVIDMRQHATRILVSRSHQIRMG